LISPEDAILAKERGVALEITTRKGHSISNGHLAKIALETGALLVINTDSHAPEDLITLERARMILRASGITEKNTDHTIANSEKLLYKIGRN